TVTGQPLRVVMPVQEKHRGNFAVHFAMVQNGRLLSQTETVTVPFTNKELTVETETFRDKLKPGQAEQWTLRISGPKQDKVLAELAATLYDASLDAFARLEWPTSFYGMNDTRPSYWDSPAFGTKQTRQYWSKPQPPYPVSERVEPQLGWGIYLYNAYLGKFTLNMSDITIHAERNGGKVSGRAFFSEVELPAPGINVVVQGTKQGAITDKEGNFSLALPKQTPKTTLLFSWIGYKHTSVELTDKQRVTVVMRQDNQALNEVVTVGYSNSPRGRLAGVAAPAPMAMAKMAVRGGRADEAMADEAPEQAGEPNVPAKAPVADPPVIRKNFNETAFFFPQLQTDKQGRVVLNFTMPEALTRWRLVTFAHTKTMQTGTMEREIVTQKELMVTTNVPRFLR
ncbi:MAG: alpha-2-macroglobulin, partial [Cytophagaceae bacterium]